MKIIQLAEATINFRDPDHEPGAIEREGNARAAYEKRHAASTEALKNDVAKKLKGKVTTWKMGRHSIDHGQEWARIELPNFTTNGGIEMSASIAHDSFSRGYSLMIVPVKTKKQTHFVKNSETNQHLKMLIAHDWEKATGQKFYGMDISIPTDRVDYDSYHSPIRINVGGPSEGVANARFVAGIKEIIQTIKMKL